ncbi:ParB/Srx family N-terminal domain-containing protein [Mesorhizobium sp. M0959]|uniref:ParB/Srx family N-terminal domain-containing protein n=1 Tax=unclassified Mesorhizobium TaxID=325217 RepID=UPI003338875D
MYSWSREYTSSLIDRALWIAGLYLVRVADFDTVLGSQFRVPINKCLNGYAIDFEANGSNPQVAFLRQYISDPSVRYEESLIRRFMADFRPRNLQEVLFGQQTDYEDDCKASQLQHYVSSLDITRPFLPMPWSTPSEISRYRQGLKALNGSLAPDLSPSIVEQESRKEYERLIATYESIKKIGYKPNIASDGALDSRFIQVVMLRDHEDERFIVMSGHHRLAALSALGWTQVPAILVANGLPIVDLANVENWPVVSEGVYDLHVARRVFKRYFATQTSIPRPAPIPS